MNDLGQSYHALGRHTDALKLHQQTLALRKAKLGSDHPDTHSSMTNLANALSALGQHTEALKLRVDTLALMRERRGSDHPETLETMANLARNLVALHRNSEAVAIVDDCLSRANGKSVAPKLLPVVVDLRMRVFARQKDAAGCRRTAEIWEGLNRKDAISLYDAACYRAVTAGVLRADPRISDASSQADAEADKALGWLAKAVAAGFRTPSQLSRMARDPDLNALRGRADFRRLVARLWDRVFPRDPFSPGKGLDSAR